MEVLKARLTFASMCTTLPSLIGIFEGDIVYGSGDDGRIAMFAGGKGGGDIHPVHQAAAHQVAKYIGVIGKNEFGHDDQGLVGCLRFWFHPVYLCANVSICSRVSVSIHWFN